MKLTEQEIDGILDDAFQYIYDDLWSEFETEWVEEYLNANTTKEYDNEDIELILKRLRDYQKESQQEILNEEKESLYQEINSFIEYSDIHLDLTDIGKVFVRLADNYLNE